MPFIILIFFFYLRYEKWARENIWWWSTLEFGDLFVLLCNVSNGVNAWTHTERRRKKLLEFSVWDKNKRVNFSFDDTMTDRHRFVSFTNSEQRMMRFVLYCILGRFFFLLLLSLLLLLLLFFLFLLSWVQIYNFIFCLRFIFVG